MNKLSSLLVLLSLVTSNIYVAESYTLTASVLTQLGYNTQSVSISIRDDDINGIDPYALNGYDQLYSFYIYSNNLKSVDVEVFKGATNLQFLFIDCLSLNKLTNSKNIKINLNELSLITNLTSLNKAMLKAFPSLTWSSFGFMGNDGIGLKTVDVHTFEDLSNLTTLELRYNLITGFEYLQIPKNLRSLDLGWNSMNYFALSRTMGVLDTLSIRNNRFRSFKSMDFTFLANLTQLKLSYNPHAYPYEIPGHLKPLSKLQRVELASLNISSIDSNYFKYNTNLQYIELTQNNITSLDYRAFKGLNDLNTVLLGYNNLTKITSGTFNNPNLVAIDLSYNQISQIDNLTFYGLGNSYLTDVYLNNNKLTKILPRTFQNTFRMIFLFYNQLTEIDNLMFDGVSGIKDLYLSYNKIEKIAPGSLNNLGSNYLDISSNNLTELKYMTFVGQMGSLRLSDNRIEKIEDGAFNYATFTDFISLSGNNLAEINNTMFAGQNQLKRIELASNKLSTIESSAFANLPTLMEVNLENNQLTQLDSSMFAGSNNLNTIYLAGNPNLPTANLQSLCPPAATQCHVYF